MKYSPFVFDDVQAAFFFDQAGPAAGALVVAGGNGARAGPAADAGITLIMQGIVGDVVIGDQLPDFLLRPVGQGTDFHQTEFLVPADDRRPRRC